MTQVKFGSAGVSAREIDLSGKITSQPIGVPAGIVGTAKKGPAFVPVTVGVQSDFDEKFGKTDGIKFGPLAVVEWLRNSTSVTYLRVLGAGDGQKRVVDGNLAGKVNSAGFVVGEQLPDPDNDYSLRANPYANADGVPGRAYLLGCLMSESAGSTYFSSAGLQGVGSVTPGLNTSLPILRAIVLAPSGVILRLSSSAEGTNTAPASTLIAADATAKGGLHGAVVLQDGTEVKQQFVLLLNGHKGTDPLYPNVITASFDLQAGDYFASVFNRDPYKYQQAGHLLYTWWDVMPVHAIVTGSGIVDALSGAFAAGTLRTGTEVSAFITTSSLDRNVGSTTVPNFENFEDRFSHGKSPWITSQKFGGRPTNLFRLHALDAGALDRTTAFKVSIQNIVKSTDPAYLYGTFDVVIRKWDDKDDNIEPYEVFGGLSLDPTSDNYICKRIGDQHTYFEFDRNDSAQKIVVEGNYGNLSNYVRVEVSDQVDQQLVAATALPFGFRGIQHLVTSGTLPMTSPASTQHFTGSALKRIVEPPVPMRQDVTMGSGGQKVVNSSLYWGVQFERVESLSTPNAGYKKNDTLWSMTKYLPDFSTVNMNVVVGDNEGTADTAANGIIDADRFCNNYFSLENIKVVTGSDGKADPQQWVNALYVRNGVIGTDDVAKTRAMQVDDLTVTNRAYAKFSLFMQGGFDGVNIFDAEEANLTDTAVTADYNWPTTRGGTTGPNVATWRKAIDIMKNTTNVDIKLFATPGIRHPIVTDYATLATEERFDALYIMDVQEYDQNNSLVVSGTQRPSVYNTAQQIKDRALDSSFAAAYYPDVILQDPNTKTNVVVPPSVVVLGAMALNDAIGYPWFAPAGFSRGALSTTLEAKVKLSKGNMDTLYDVGVNPLIAFPSQSGQGLNPQGGVVVWGQKTLQAAASALDRVNVRRLLIEIRRQVREIAQTIIFEPNRETTLAKFSAAVTPRLQKIQTLQGLDRFKVIIDSSTTTQQDVENNTVRGKIFVQPTRSIEYVSLDFVVTNQNNFNAV